MEVKLDRIAHRVLIKDEDSYYYILKVEQHNSETFCFFPKAGFHFTEHKSGEAHIQAEPKSTKTTEGIPIAVTTGAAGQPFGTGFRHQTPDNLGAADSITEVLVLIDSLDSEYQKYNRRLEDCFVIDKALLSEDTSLLHNGVWYVPSRNKVSFEFNNRDIPDHLLYKVTQCEPQIWIFAEPFD